MILLKNIENEETDMTLVDQTDEHEGVGEQVKDFITFLADTFGRSSERAMRAVNQKNMYDNIAIFVDYDNVYWTLMNNYQHDPDHREEEKNLFNKLWERYGQDNIRTFRAYADFQKIRTSLTSLQKKRIQLRHVYSNDKEGDKRKNSSDIELCIDAIESTYKDKNISTYVFVTADSDMIPILSRMMYKGKQVELFYLDKAAPQHVDITNYAHVSHNLLEFLNIQEKDYNLDDYIIPAIKIVDEWHRKFDKVSDRYLGKAWLRGELSKKLNLPSEKCSVLIEKLIVDSLIFESKKELSKGETKPSIKLTDEAKLMIAGTGDTVSL
ncbi:hypothetical protein JIMMER1_40 [Brevibacillus phage Jimmer1]|uniref:NYN domain-containing protein n=4 Tax=Jimmervirus TaxID=1984788 RepID=S5M5F6_9CAUD|nr:hypothetical protein AVV10_gp042 [Brevibacillus phage Osiris]YP_009226350.1 hypothetical protein AXJ21_gp040 [Brevibacillus phage Jimmer1]YP_009606467.1 hypothetical protein FDI01_gp040 [Brevibacillus phage Jimmer2]ALA48052.1 hypothetical protein POWDER_42 [Brevibacillus phage Powder]AGR47181.1 hypothetical protein JIMMER2_40 [Brevibacillus phage Jimmer2]AGR47284.1 hypothetical protein JIMMER1_40 [Brevibacillus phage Jimmer1]ALA07335.1 hypothetical protein OSIRIS_42 [Brevibacillus phage Os